MSCGCGKKQVASPSQVQSQVNEGRSVSAGAPTTQTNTQQSESTSSK